MSICREEIAGKMGVDIVFGATESEMSRISDIKWWGWGFGIFKTMWPKSLGRKTAVSFWDIISLMSKVKDVPGRGKGWSGILWAAWHMPIP